MDQPNVPNIPTTSMVDRTPARVPDPGSPRLAIVAWILGLILFGVIVVTNQMGAGVTQKAAQASKATAIKEGVALDPFTMISKMVAKLSHFAGSSPEEKKTLLGQVENNAQNNQDRFRLALLASYLGGDDEALRRLSALEKAIGKTQELAPSGDVPGPEARLVADIAAAREILSGGTIPDERREAFVKAHGWFAQLALQHLAPETAPAKQALLVNGGVILVIVLAMVLLALVAFVGGIAAFVTMLVSLSSGRIRRSFVAPAPGGSVYLEMVALFMGGFLALGAVGSVVVAINAGAVPSWLLPFKFVAQWLLLLVLFYPLLRGVSWSRLRHDLGLYSGRGVLREMACGVWGYFAGLPLLFVAFLMVFGYLALRGAFQAGGRGGKGVEVPENPIAEMLAGASVLELLLLFLLASVWAPIVEETIFRGALFRHLRSRVHFVVAAIVSALAFGFMHSYPIPLLLPVITIGFNFALMREWRGSTLASITAHAMHNATLLSLAIPLVYALR